MLMGSAMPKWSGYGAKNLMCHAEFFVRVNDI